MPSPGRGIPSHPKEKGKNHRRPSEWKYCYYVGGKYKLQSARFGEKKTISYQFSNGVTIFFFHCFVMSQADIVFASTVPERRSAPQFLKIFSHCFFFFPPLKKTKQCSGLLLLSPTAEAEKTPANLGAESAAPAATPGSAEDKPKEDVAEPSSSTATDTTVDGKTDGESLDSVELLKEPNVNNSNNNSRGLSPQRGLH